MSLNLDPTTSAPDLEVARHGARNSAWGRRNLALVLLGLVAGAIVAAGATATRPTVYESSATFILQSAASASQTETLVRNMMALVPDVNVGEDLQRVTGIDRDPADIAERLLVERPPGSSVLTITYSDEDEQSGQAVVAALEPVLNARVERLQSTAGDAPVFALSPWSGTDVTTVRNTPPVLRNAGLGAVVGLAVGLCLSLVLPTRRPGHERD